MDQDFQYLIFGLVLSMVLLYLWIQAQKYHEIIINEGIIGYYKDLEMEVVKITPLKLKEKVQYGIPIFNYYELYVQFSYFVPFYTIVNRRAELVDMDGNEHLKYVEISIFNNTLKGIKEFDSYEI